MPSSRSLPHAALGLLSLLAVPVLVACGDDSSRAGASVGVSAKDDACVVEKTDLQAGTTTFKVKNEGNKVTEVYVYAEKDGKFTKVVSEVENIGPGTSRDLKVKLSGGTYEIACKPGQKGDGIRQKVTVAGAAASTSEDGAYDREIEVAVSAAGVTGLDGAKATKGEKIEFKLENTTDGTRTLEVLDPSGKVVEEFDVAAGKDGEAVVELAQSGTWTVKVEGGSAEVEKPLPVS